MRIEENAGGGDTVILEPDDSLLDVPKSHRELVSPSIRDAFAEPIEYFRKLANRSSIGRLSSWLRALVAEGAWELELNRGCPYDERIDWCMSGFRWTSDFVLGALVGLPGGQRESGFPTGLREYYRFVDVVHWSAFGGAGGLEGANAHTPLSNIPYELRDARVSVEDLFLFGMSSCGDALIYSVDGRGGWFNHETGQVHWLGSITDMIDWVFGEMLEGRTPDCNFA